MIQPIELNTLKSKLDAGEPMVLVEALPARYYEAEHLPGAINIPHDQIHRLAPEYLPDKNKPVVVYCASTDCQNSRIAAQALEIMGYRQVLEYVEGKADWKAAGLPLEGV